MDKAVKNREMLVQEKWIKEEKRMQAAMHEAKVSANLERQVAAEVAQRAGADRRAHEQAAKEQANVRVEAERQEIARAFSREEQESEKARIQAAVDEAELMAEFERQALEHAWRVEEQEAQVEAERARATMIEVDRANAVVEAGMVRAQAAVDEAGRLRAQAAVEEAEMERLQAAMEEAERVRRQAAMDAAEMKRLAIERATRDDEVERRLAVEEAARRKQAMVRAVEQDEADRQLEVLTVMQEVRVEADTERQGREQAKLDTEKQRRSLAAVEEAELVRKMAATGEAGGERRQATIDQVESESLSIAHAVREHPSELHRRIHIELQPVTRAAQDKGTLEQHAVMTCTPEALRQAKVQAARDEAHKQAVLESSARQAAAAIAQQESQADSWHTAQHARAQLARNEIERCVRCDTGLPAVQGECGECVVEYAEFAAVVECAGVVMSSMLLSCRLSVPS